MNMNLHILLITTILVTLSSGSQNQYPRPGQVITNSVGMKLVYVPAGKFKMGSSRNTQTKDKDEIPQHHVHITKGFFIGQTEVTLGQFLLFTEDMARETEAERERWSYSWINGSFQIVYGASFRDAGFPQTNVHPVVCVSWNDAVEYCNWLGYKEGKNYRLPTEAEWEYACRGGESNLYQWGNHPKNGAGWCNVGDLTAKEEFKKVVAPSRLFPWYDGHIFTAPVGQFRANAFGLYDMHGNVLEFCRDWYSEDYYKVSKEINPSGPTSGKLRVIRGGSWSSYPMGCRSAKRYRDKQSIRCSNLGFRVTLDPD